MVGLHLALSFPRKTMEAKGIQIVPCESGNNRKNCRIPVDN